MLDRNLILDKLDSLHHQAKNLLFIAIDLWQLDGDEQKIRWLRGYVGPPTTLHARPENGDFVFEGGNIDRCNKGSIKLKGLSSTEIAAKNLGAFNVPVAASETHLQVAFPAAEVDPNYAILVECSWITNKAVTNKQKTGFTVAFDQPTPQSVGTLDWLLIR